MGRSRQRRGGGGDQYLADLEKDAAGLPVEFVGPVYDTNRLAEIYRACSIFVYPSVAEQGETFGLAPLEAMAFGCVPVVSDLACFRDFVRDGHNGVVFNHRGDSPVESLSKCLDGLVEDAALQKKLSNEAKMVCTTHSPEIIADLFLRDFEAMAK